MARENLTTRSIPNLDIGDYQDSDQRGLWLRVGKTKKTFYHRYNLNGKQKRDNSVGQFPETSLAEAREYVRENLKLISQGIDPVHRKQHVQENTFFKVCDQILSNLEMVAERMETQKKIARPGTRTLIDYRIQFKHCEPLYDQSMENINRIQVQTLLDKIGAENGLVQAKNCRALIHNLFERAIRKGLVNREDNPAKRTKVDQIVTPDESGQGALNKDQIAELWIRSALLPDVQRTMVRTSLLTGLRIGNVCTMKYDNIEDGIYEVSARNFKGRRTFILPLSDMLQGIIEDHQKVMKKAFNKHRRNNPYLFPAATKDAKTPHITISSTNKVFERCQRNNGNKYFTSHAMRKTVETHLARIDCPDVIIDQMVGHQMVALKRRYNKYAYLKQKIEWFNCWAKEVQRIVTEWKENNPSGVETIWKEWESNNAKLNKHARKNPDRIRKIFDRYI